MSKAKRAISKIEHNDALGSWLWHVSFPNEMPADPKHVPGRPWNVLGASSSEIEAAHQAKQMAEAFSKPRIDHRPAQPADVRVFKHGGEPEDRNYDRRPTITMSADARGDWVWFITLPAGFPADAGYVPGRPFGITGFSGNRESALKDSSAALYAVDPEQTVGLPLLRILEMPPPPFWPPAVGQRGHSGPMERTDSELVVLDDQGRRPRKKRV